MNGAVFVIDTQNGSRRTIGTNLSVAKDGALRVRDGQRLVAVCRSGYWLRCFVEVPVIASNALIEKEGASRANG